MSSSVRPSRKLWLADHLLADLCGHHFNYNLTLARAALAAGWQASLLCRKSPEFSAPDGIETIGIFRADWRSQPTVFLTKWRWALDGLEEISRRRFFGDLASGAPARLFHARDIVFAQMLAPRHFAGWLRWMERLPEANVPELVLHLGYDPTRFAADREISACLAEARRLSHVHYVTDSERLVPHYEKALNGPVRVLPHVISEDLPCGSGSQESEIVFACPGNPRREKGFVEYAGAILQILTGGEEAVRFIAQVNDPDDASKDSVEQLKANGLRGVEIVDRRLSEQEYFHALAAADVIVLPYHLDKYRDRTSGIFCEALASGKPVIVTEGSWMSGEIARTGAGWLVPERDKDALARTIREAAAQFGLVAEKARGLAAHYREMFSPAHFIEKLAQLDGK